MLLVSSFLPRSVHDHTHLQFFYLPCRVHCVAWIATQKTGGITTTNDDMTISANVRSNSPSFILPRIRGEHIPIGSAIIITVLIEGLPKYGDRLEFGAQTREARKKYSVEVDNGEYKYHDNKSTSGQCSIGDIIEMCVNLGPKRVVTFLVNSDVVKFEIIWVAKLWPFISVSGKSAKVTVLSIRG